MPAVPCTISDTLTGYQNDTITAYPTVYPTSFVSTLLGNITIHHNLEPLRALTSTAGAFSLTLPWPSEVLAGGGPWTVSLSDGTQAVGAIPEGVSGPLSLAQLTSQYGWSRSSVFRASISTATFTTAGSTRQMFYNVRDFGAAGDGVTDDYTAILNAHTAAAAAGGVLFFPPGTYLTKTSIVPASGVSWLGCGRGNTSIKAGGTSTAIIKAVTGVSDVTIEGLTFDGNTQASCVLFYTPENLNITICRCRLFNVVQNSAITVNGTNLGNAVIIGTAVGAPANGGPKNPSKNIAFYDNIVGPNLSFYEAVGFQYCQNLRAWGNSFIDNNTAPAGTGLAIYAYCRGVALWGNTFNGNLIDCYIQQSDTVSYDANVHIRKAAGSSLGLYNVQGVSVGGTNTFYDPLGTSTAISVIDQLDADLAHFNGNVSIYPASKGLNIAPGITYDNYLYGVRVYSPPFTSTQVGVNNATDIRIGKGLHILPVGGIAVVIGGPLAQNFQRITVDAQVAGGCNYAGGFGVAVQGNAGIGAGTTTTAPITGNGYATKQFLQVSALATGIQLGQWFTLTDGTPTDLYVYAYGTGATVTAGSVGALTPPAGPWILVQVGGSHTYVTGSTIQSSASIVNNGITSVLLDGVEVNASSAGNSSGVLLWTCTGVRLEHCNLRLAGSGTGSKLSLISASAARVFDCPGLNPAGGAVTTPGVPASGVAVQNTTGYDCFVTITGGTVTGVSVTDGNGANAKTTATSTPAFVLVPALAYITLTYSAAPTWAWYGN